jgi:hypothetical protein
MKRAAKPAKKSAAKPAKKPTAKPTAKPAKKPATKSKTPPESKQAASIGRGHKLCPDCEVTVGARTKTCQCGYSFTLKVEGGEECKGMLIQMLSKVRGGMDLVQIAVARKERPHHGCDKIQCQLDNKQLQALLTLLVKEGELKKEGKKYKVIK